jgi:hypothetical protein
MSYRAFKRLLGETSLERKCRFLFGAGILLLITLSFWLYGYQTEQLAYDQATVTCRLLVRHVLWQQHLPYLQAKAEAGLEGKALQEALNLADPVALKDLGKEYQYHFLTEKHVDDSYERDLFKEFSSSDEKVDDTRPKTSEQVLLYYAPIRMSIF